MFAPLIRGGGGGRSGHRVMIGSIPHGAYSVELRPRWCHYAVDDWLAVHEPNSFFQFSGNMN
jgi:hypothetical protein